MTPSDLLSDLRPAAERAGVGPVDGSSPSDVLSLLDELTAAAEHAWPDAAAGPTPAARREARYVERVVELAASGLSDSQIAHLLHSTPASVRKVRRSRAVAGTPGNGRPARSGWEAPLRAAHARGLSVAEMAAELRCSPAAVYHRCSALGLSLRARGAL